MFFFLLKLTNINLLRVLFYYWVYKARCIVLISLSPRTHTLRIIPVFSYPLGPRCRIMSWLNDKCRPKTNFCAINTYDTPIMSAKMPVTWTISFTYFQVFLTQHQPRYIRVDMCPKTRKTALDTGLTSRKNRYTRKSKNQSIIQFCCSFFELEKCSKNRADPKIRCKKNASKRYTAQVFRSLSKPENRKKRLRKREKTKNRA